MPFLVDCPIQVCPLSMHIDICLPHPPAASHRSLVLSEYLFQQGQKTNCPATVRKMVVLRPTLLHHSFNIATTQSIRRVSPDAHLNDFLWKSHAFHLQHNVPHLPSHMLSRQTKFLPPCVDATAPLISASQILNSHHTPGKQLIFMCTNRRLMISRRRNGPSPKSRATPAILGNRS